MTFDGKAFGLEIVSAVKAHITDVVGPILARLDAVERRFAELPAPKDGKDADISEVVRLAADRILPELKDLRSAIEAIGPAPELPDVAGMISEAVAAIPDPISADEVKALVDEAVAAIPPANDGVDGKDGTPGRDGVDGKDGAPGEKGDTGERGEKGEAGLNGKDGLDAVEFILDVRGHLIASMSNGTTRDLGFILGKDGAAGRDGVDGAPGKDGLDGVGFDDLDLIETEAGVMLRCTRGENVKEWRLPIVIDRGVFKEGHTYRKGDGVTWGGSFWIAQDETTDKPDTGKGWRLAVKKGRDGRDGIVKEQKPVDPIKVR